MLPARAFFYSRNRIGVDDSKETLDSFLAPCFCIAAAAAGNRSCRTIVEKCCFSRISERTLGSFCGSVFELAGPSGALSFAAGRCFFFSRNGIGVDDSKETLDSFSVPFFV